MAFLYVGKGVQADVGTGNLTLTEPSGTTTGDLLVAMIAYRDTPAFTPPAGWTAIASVAGNTSTGTAAAAGCHMSYIVRGAGAPALTFTRTGGAAASGVITAYRNNSGTPFVANTANAVGGHTTTPAFAMPTTTANGQLIVGVFAGALGGGPTLSMSSGDISTYWNDVETNYATDTINDVNPWDTFAFVGNEVVTGSHTFTPFHAIKPDKGTSASLNVTIGDDADHSSIIAVFASTFSDDRVYDLRSPLYAQAGFIREGISTRVARLHAMVGFEDKGISTRSAHLFAIIDPNLSDVRRLLKRRVITNKTVHLTNVLEQASEFGLFVSQDGNSVFTDQLGTSDFQIQRDIS